MHVGGMGERKEGREFAIERTWHIAAFTKGNKHIQQDLNEGGPSKGKWKEGRILRKERQHRGGSKGKGRAVVRDERPSCAAQEGREERGEGG